MREQSNLRDIYHDYIACLNRQDWGRLGDFVQGRVIHNGRHLGLSGYRAMLERNFRDIPDLHFDVQLLVVESALVASRLQFDCTPQGSFLDLRVDGRRISFTENIFYRFFESKIAEAWSIIDKAAVEAQL